jgi:hypothetical protein
MGSQDSKYPKNLEESQWSLNGNSFGIPEKLLCKLKILLIDCIKRKYLQIFKKTKLIKTGSRKQKLVCS